MATVFVCRDFILDPLLDKIADALAQRGAKVIRGPESIPGQVTRFAPEADAALFEDCDVLMFSSRNIASREVMRAAPRLRAIVNPTIGLETVDIAAADELGIIIGHGAIPENYLGMAEAAVMLMLALRYGLHASEAVLRGSRPAPGFDPARMHARMLRGSTVGIVGPGRIGRAVIDRLQAFDVRILATGSGQRPMTELPNTEIVALDTLLRESDLVGLFASMNEGNRHMINEETLGLMKPGACLINVARGGLVDERALYRALRDGRLAGAALDTFEVEPLAADSPLRQLDNVILTPHSVGVTREFANGIVPAAIENIERVMRGEPPLYCKNPYLVEAWRERLRLLAGTVS